MIYVLTGPVQTGKTTALAEWVGRRVAAAGLLQPVRGGKRYLKSLPSGEVRPLECSGAEDAVQVGRFRFSASVFAWGRRKLREAHEREPEWLFIDEIGPLELRGEGLAPAVETVLCGRGESSRQHALLVVRERLLEIVSERYALDETRVLRPGELPLIAAPKSL